MVIPNLESAHFSVAGHLTPIRADRSLGSGQRITLLKFEVASGDDDARRQPLNIPFPWSRQGFVEIVGVEIKLAFRSRERTKVHEVAVAAGLYPNPGCRCPREVRSHYRR